MPERLIAVCPHDCPSACSLVVTVENDRLLDVTGNPAHPFTAGVICGKVRAYAERVHSPLRVREPMRRAGAKGEGRLEPISWDDAIAEIARRFGEITDRWGAEAILPFSYAGTMGLLQYHAGHPFFHALGASQLERTICVSAALAGWKATLGAMVGSAAEAMVDAELVVLWGINAAYTHINLMTLVKRARKRGASIVVIDPYRTRTASEADTHLSPRPGTDAALALGVMHVLVRDGRVDHRYIQRATFGFEALRRHVEQYDPATVAGITGLRADEIEDFARRYGATPATFIRLGVGLSRHDNGGMTCRTIACLPALTGAYAHPTGGALLDSAASFPLNLDVLERRDLLPTPAPRAINMIRLGAALTDAGLAPPVKALYVYNSNPAAVCPNQELVLQGLRREDLFTVVHEQVFTDTTDFADLVLPATTSMEHLDLYRSYGHLYLQLSEPVIRPLASARSNREVFGLLARALGLRDRQFEVSDVDLIREVLNVEHPALEGVTYERLRMEHFVRLKLEEPYLPFANGAPTPSGRVEFYSEVLAAQGLPALPTYVPLVEGPDNAELARRFPLQLIVPPNRFFLNSSFSQSELLRRRQGTPTVMIHPTDARRRGIEDGATVRVTSARGAARFTARLTEDSRVGVAVVEGIWWRRFSGDGRGVNVLTPDRVVDMGGGPAFHSNLVEIAPDS